MPRSGTDGSLRLRRRIGFTGPSSWACGLSDQPPLEYHYTPASIGEQIAVLDTLSLSRAHWVGESSGGLIGLLLAAANPERVASLVLCNTPSRIPDRIRRIYALDRDDAGAAFWNRWVPPIAETHRIYRPELLGLLSSEQQKTFAGKLPNGRLQSFAGYGHGVNLLLPERCAQAALTFWNSLASAGNAQRRAGDIARLV
jgi:hypothetical protein